MNNKQFERNDFQQVKLISWENSMIHCKKNDYNLSCILKLFLQVREILLNSAAQFALKVRTETSAWMSLDMVTGCRNQFVWKDVFVFDIAMLIAYSDRLLYLVFRMKCTNKCDLYAWHANLTSLLHFKRALEFVTCLSSIAFYISCLFLLLQHASRQTDKRA